jgi:hypothetical protein
MAGAEDLAYFFFIIVSTVHYLLREKSQQSEENYQASWSIFFLLNVEKNKGKREAGSGVLDIATFLNLIYVKLPWASNCPTSSNSET